jgi:hypothetical protein
MSSKKGEQDELQLLLRSRFPILVVETAEERRFLASSRWSQTSTRNRCSRGAWSRA